jgi:beta-fructofuranosidase
VLRDDDRTLIWGWAQERRPQAEIDDAGWAGTLTFCRELRLVDDRLVSEPVPELDALRCQALDVEPGVPFTATAFDIELGAGAGVASLSLLDDAGEHQVVAFEVAASPLTQPRILVDGSIIEAFDGTGIAFTTRAYPTTTSTWRLLLERGADLRAWKLVA